MISITPPNPKSAQVSDHQFDLDKLEGLLTDLETEHETLLSLAGRQRDAIARADTGDLGTIVEQTTQTLGRIASIEHSRRKAIVRPDGSLPTVDQIASVVEPDAGNRLTDRAASLRALMQQIKHEHKAVREASVALSNHMSGLMEQVSAKLSHSGTYGRRGTVDPGRQQVISSLDTSR